MSSRDVAHSTVTPAAVASALPFDRMAALGKWIAAKADEMHQLDARIERRLEHLHRSEESLRTLCESVRQQVVAAQEATEEYKSAQRETVERTVVEPLASTGSRSPSDQEKSLQDALGLAAMLAETIDIKSSELQKTADLIVQSTADRLDALFKQAYEIRTIAVHEDFEKRSTSLVESIRRSAVEQIERLGSQATVSVEPVLDRITRQQEQAETQLRSCLESAEDALRRRAEQLARAGDTIVDALEQRLARRVENIRPRTEQALAAADQIVQNRLAAIIDAARKDLASAQEDLRLQAAQLRPQLSEMIERSQDELVEQLARMEEHAFAMTGWLEQRMGERVDALVQRSRGAFAATGDERTGDLTNEQPVFADEYGIPTPMLELSIFVDKTVPKSAPNRRSSPFLRSA